MKAIIRFPDGLEATVIDEEGTWVCENEVIRLNLQLRTELLPHFYDPNPTAWIAEQIAEQVGAEVIYTDKVTYGDAPPERCIERLHCRYPADVVTDSYV